MPQSGSNSSCPGVENAFDDDQFDDEPLPTSFQTSSSNQSDGNLSSDRPTQSHSQSLRETHGGISRPKRPLTAFETYVRFEMMLSTQPLLNENKLSVDESEFHWKEWSTMPSWKKQVYQNLAEADERRYKKELQVWQDSKGSKPVKMGDLFKARLYQRKASGPIPPQRTVDNEIAM